MRRLICLVAIINLLGCGQSKTSPPPAPNAQGNPGVGQIQEWIAADTIFRECRKGGLQAAKRYEGRRLSIRGAVSATSIDDFFRTISMTDGDTTLQFSFSRVDIADVENAEVGSVLQIRGYCVAAVAIPPGQALDLTSAHVEDVITKRRP